MKRIAIYISVFFLSLFSYKVKAQPKYFERTYSWNGNLNTNGFSIIEKNNGNYTIIGPFSNDNTTWQTFLLEISSIGSIVNTIEYNELYDNNVMKDIVIMDTCLLMGGFFSNDTIGITSILKTDYNGNDIYYEVVGQNAFTNHCNTICLTSDNNFFLGGEIQPYDSTVSSPPTHPYLVKLDEQGNKLWDTIYYQFGPPYYSWFIDSKATPDGGALLLGTDRANYYHGNILLVKIDSLGNILQQGIFNYGNVEYGGSVIPTSDGGYLISGGWFMPPETVYNQGGLIIKVAANMIELWHNSSFFYDYVASGKVYETANGDYVVSGSYMQETDMGNELNAEIIKLSPNNELLWQRHYGVNNQAYDYIIDMIATSDGGYISCGRYDSFGIAKVYALKTNCMGLLTEPQAAFAALPQSDNVVMFENQSLYAYPDSIDGGHYIWDFGDGSAPFVCGQGFGPCPDLVQHIYPAQGTYTATLTAVVCSDTSVVSQAVSAVLVGLPAVEGLGLGAWVRVWPNPAHQNLYIDHYLPDGQSAQASLYDLNGRLLQTHTLSGRGTLSISTQNLPEGMYFCRILQADQTITTHKVVIVK